MNERWRHIRFVLYSFLIMGYVVGVGLLARPWLLADQTGTVKFVLVLTLIHTAVPLIIGLLLLDMRVFRQKY